MKVWGSDLPVNFSGSTAQVTPDASPGGQMGPVPVSGGRSMAAATSTAVTTALADISLEFSPLPVVQERIPASALPPEARQLFTEAQLAMGSFGRSRFFLEQLVTAEPGTAAFASGAMQALLRPDGSTASGRAVQQLLQTGASTDSALLLAAQSAEAPRALFIVRDAVTGERFRLQTPWMNSASFRPAPGDLLTLYWGGLSMEGPLGGLYLRHDRSGDGVVMADLRGLAVSWRKRVRNLIQAGLLFLGIVGILLGLAVLAGSTSDSSEALTVSSLIFGSLFFLLYLGFKK